MSKQTAAQNGVSRVSERWQKHSLTCSSFLETCYMSSSDLSLVLRRIYFLDILAHKHAHGLTPAHTHNAAGISRWLKNLCAYFEFTLDAPWRSTASINQGDDGKWKVLVNSHKKRTTTRDAVFYLPEYSAAVSTQKGEFFLTGSTAEQIAERQEKIPRQY